MSYGGFQPAKCAEFRAGSDFRGPGFSELVRTRVFGEILIDKVTFQGHIPLSLIPVKGGFTYEARLLDHTPPTQQLKIWA